MGSGADIDGQRARIAELEAALWRDGLDEDLLEPYQHAFRDLEDMLAEQGPDRRHHVVIVIPVADSPQQLQTCLDSLLAQCRAFGYGGIEHGRYRKISVLLADDSADPEAAAQDRRIAARIVQAGIAVEYFGLDEQLALLARLQPADLGGIVGRHAPAAFGHKGQAMMRNIAYLRLAEMQAHRPDQRLLFYTIDADQAFQVKVATPRGGCSVNAINYFHHLDRLFDQTPVQVLTGKVVGDPPVSPAVMAGNFLADVLGFLSAMADCDPDAPYLQPGTDTRGSGEAAYHDMAEMFGFTHQQDVYRYHCRLPGSPDNAACFAEFAWRLNGFFHGEHPTRITWYRYHGVAGSCQPARTVYTGNYAFTAAALRWFIPFAPLRLRMSGPTMGRLLQAELGDAFASANLPMLHRRTLARTGESEFRPGVAAQQGAVDLSDEFERQFHGDVMLFAMQRMIRLGYPVASLSREQMVAILDTTHGEMREKYRSRQQLVLERLDRLRSLLHERAQWWNRLPALHAALDEFDNFADNIERNFGATSPALARIDAPDGWRHWRARLLAAIMALHADRAAWQQALTILRDGCAA